jgi:L-fuconolactonase
VAGGGVSTAPVELIDAHVHVWDPGAREHAWLAAHPALRRRFLPADLDPGRHELAGMVVVQADCRDDEGLDEVAWIGALAGRDRRIRAIVAFAPLERGERVAEHLEALARFPLVAGVRRLLQDEPAALMGDPAFVAGVRRLGPARLTFDACVTHAQLPALTRLARGCPDVTFVLDHLGKPDVRGGRLDPWREDLRTLAARPNVVCKLSGLTAEAAAAWTDADVAPFLAHAIDAFGPARCMLGSDWPLVTQTASHERWTDAVLASLSPLTAGERRDVLVRNAGDVYRPTPRSAHAGRQLHR